MSVEIRNLFLAIKRYVTKVKHCKFSFKSLEFYCIRLLLLLGMVWVI